MRSFDDLMRLYGRGEYTTLAAMASECLADGVLIAEPGSAVIIAVSCATSDSNEDAERLFAALVAKEPGNLAYKMNLAVQWLQMGRTRPARSLLDGIHAESPATPDVAFNLGLACFADQDYLAARSVLASVLRSDPGHEWARLYLARSLVETGDVHDAQVLVEGFSFPEQNAGVREREELSRLHTALDQPEKAEQILRRLLSEFPDLESSKISLAGLLERANRPDEAQDWLDRVSGPERESAVFIAMQAKLLAARKSWGGALARFDEALKQVPDDLSVSARNALNSDIEFGRGHALDKLERYAEAQATLVRANELIRDHFRHYHPARTDQGRRIEALDDRLELDAAVLAAAGEVRLAPADTPIFLVGFPRSGTTLLDQILDAHPGLQVLEEKPAIDTVAAAVGSLSPGYPAALAKLSLANAARLRALYWQTVSQHLQRKPGAQLVDKYPLNLARIHLIMRLFPKAKWIFAIRHPCDVVLSCFMQNFRFTESTHGFWSIDQTASIYEQVMGLWLQQRERLKPDCLDLRYEDLIADFEPNARRLIAFLGLPWHADVLRYNEHAKTRRISTPSYSQVTQPIYRTAAGRWRNYEPWFGEALPLLRPFIERLGYAE